MPNRAPDDSLEVSILRLGAAALSLATVIGIVAREWEPLIGLGPLVSGIIGTAAGALLAVVVRLIRR